MTKRERVKMWIKRHQDAILLSGIGTVVVGLVIVAIKADMAYQERTTSELNGYIDDLNALHEDQELRELIHQEEIEDASKFSQSNVDAEMRDLLRLETEFSQ